MNITEKILARGAGESKLEPGDVKFAKIDKVMLHDVSGPGVIKTFEKLEKDGVLKVDKLFDPSMIWVTEDHFLYDVVKSGFEKVAEKYSTDFPLFSVQKMADFRINRYSEGGYMSSHLDTIVVTDKNQYGRPQVSALIYVNDDYEGGEFKIIDKTFKPEAGSAVIFPSNFMFPHESKVITRGKKWSIVTWLM